MIKQETLTEHLMKATQYASSLEAEIELLKHENKLLQPQSTFDQLPDLLTKKIIH